jgi:hypothetical protein
MGIGIGTIVIADGAILLWVVGAATAGYVLLGVGGSAVLLSLVFWSSWAGRGYFAHSERLHRRW